MNRIPQILLFPARSKSFSLARVARGAEITEGKSKFMPFASRRFFSPSRRALRPLREIIVFLFLFAAIVPQGAPAQGPPERKGWEERGGRGMMGPMHPSMMDWASQLNLTPEQAAKLQDLREAFLRDTLTWRNELLIKRFDLRDLLRNPQSDSQAILNKQREISDLEAKIQERGILLQIELRKVLTPEQIKLLPPHGGGMYGTPGMPGRGRGMGREY